MGELFDIGRPGDHNVPVHLLEALFRNISSAIVWLIISFQTDHLRAVNAKDFLPSWRQVDVEDADLPSLLRSINRLANGARHDLVAEADADCPHALALHSLRCVPDEFLDPRVTVECVVAAAGQQDGIYIFELRVLFGMNDVPSRKFEIRLGVEDRVFESGGTGSRRALKTPP
jgi:hypothetical protein